VAAGRVSLRTGVSEDQRGPIIVRLGADAEIDDRGGRGTPRAPRAPARDCPAHRLRDVLL